MLQVQTLTKRFGDRTAVDSMSFDVESTPKRGAIAFWW